MAVLPGIVTALFNNEDNPLRLERVCLDLYCEAEGVQLVPTSRTWDRSRDGRRISIGGEALPGVLCVTLSVDLDAKVKKDICRLAKTTQTNAIIYCTSRELTESACDRIEAAIRELYPTAESVRVLGQLQLAALGERFEDILRRHYAAEIQNIEEALLFQPTAASDPEHIGLRLALITQTGDDARALRNELAKRLVLDTVNASGPQSPSQLAVAISGQLHLPRSLTANYVIQVLSQLREEGLVAIQYDDRASLTPSGVDFVNAIPHEATTKLLEGRAAIREAIRMLSGHKLTDDQYDRVWNCVQDGIADLFYSHGAAIVRMVASLLSDESIRPEPKARVLLERLGDKIASLFSFPEQGGEVRQAVIDMFSEKDSEAFKWLTQVCTVYVMMCSLGIEGVTSQQVTRVLRGFRLVPDSDVILSLLCEKEKNHEDVDRVLTSWRALGGKLLMATPVLEEVAYHAWIAERDYGAMWDQLDRISDFDADHLIENAFVRTFRGICGGKTDRRFWSSYIRQYRGDTERDFAPVMEILTEDCGFGRLSDADEQYKSFAAQVEQFLIERVSADANCKADELDYRLLDKCRRDVILLAAVHAQRDAARQSGIGGAAMVLSSARLLKEADEVFRTELGHPDAVLSTAALGCLLTLTPGVQMGLGTLRGVLFDMGLAARLTPMQRYAYRLIAASGEVDVPWSRRGTLQRELGQRLLRDARASGKPVGEIKKKVLQSADPQYSVRFVAAALDEMAVTPETQKELARLRAEVSRLQEDLRVRGIRDQTKGPALTMAAPSERKKRKRRK